MTHIILSLITRSFTGEDSVGQAYYVQYREGVPQAQSFPPSPKPTDLDGAIKCFKVMGGLSTSVTVEDGVPLSKARHIMVVEDQQDAKIPNCVDASVSNMC